MDETKGNAFVKVLKGIIVVLIPLLFFVTTVILTLRLFGYETDEIKSSAEQLFSKIPVVSEWTEEPKEAKALEPKTKHDETENTQQMEVLEKQIENKNSEIADLEKQIEQLNERLEKASKVEDEVVSEGNKVIAETYENMDTSKAAMIFDQMSLETAAKYINLLSNRTKAEILEHLPPEKAAELTPLLK